MANNKERPIIFNGDMVRAILDGRKTQTRRIMKNQPAGDSPETPALIRNVGDGYQWHGHYGESSIFNCPFGRPCERLWVRESYRMPESLDRYSPRQVGVLALESGYRKPWAPIQLEADGVRTGKWIGVDTPPIVTEPGKLRPSIHMPRWASRITLEITGVRVERLNDISEADARAEGVIDGGCLTCGEPEPCGCANPQPDATDAFAGLWESVYGDESWQANPWVWVIEFKRVEGNNDGE